MVPAKESHKGNPPLFPIRKPSCRTVSKASTTQWGASQSCRLLLKKTDLSYCTCTYCTKATKTSSVADTLCHVCGPDQKYALNIFSENQT